MHGDRSRTARGAFLAAAEAEESDRRGNWATAAIFADELFVGEQTMPVLLLAPRLVVLIEMYFSATTAAIREGIYCLPLSLSLNAHSGR